MLSRAFDRLLVAFVELPECCATLRRAWDGDPARLAALDQLETALGAARSALQAPRRPAGDLDAR